MNREKVRAGINEIGIIPSVRVPAAELALFAATSLNDAGLPVAEITLTVPGAIDLITKLATSYPNFIVGAGTVLDAETAERCVNAGARFLTSPGLIPEVLDVARKHDLVVIPGALTPTEVVCAWKAGADFVKVFPCAPVGGSKYIRALKVPLPQIPLIASGGVNQLTAADFILAGASALGIGSELFPMESLESRRDKWIRELVRRFTTIVKNTRAQMSR